MAKSRDNVVMQGASGIIGRTLVFRQRGDKTIIARRPRQKEGEVKTYTDDQLAAQSNFLDATIYAKSIMEDPALKAAYAQKANVNQSAYNVAMKDYLKKPIVRRLDDRAYHGLPGDILTLLVQDVMQVVEVGIEIIDSGGAVVEAGHAEPLDSQGARWQYTAEETHPAVEDAMYRVIMVDTPSNTTEALFARHGAPLE